MVKRALKEKVTNLSKKKSFALPEGVEKTQGEEVSIGQAILEDVEALSSESFGSETQALEVLIDRVIRRYPDPEGELKDFISELIESDPELKADILSTLLVNKA